MRFIWVVLLAILIWPSVILAQFGNTTTIQITSTSIPASCSFLQVFYTTDTKNYYDCSNGVPTIRGTASINGNPVTGTVTATNNAPNQYGTANQWMTPILFNCTFGSPQPAIPNDIQCGQSYQEVTAGGTNAAGNKSNYQSLSSTHVQRTSGQGNGTATYSINYSNGDTLSLYGLSQSFGSTNANGDEGTEAIRGESDDGATESTFVITGIASAVVTYNTGSATNAIYSGEQRTVIDTTVTPYTTGTISSFSAAAGATGPTVNGSGTAWNTAFSGNADGGVATTPNDYCFYLDGGNAATSLLYVFQIQSYVSATSITLNNIWTGTQQNWVGDATSGTYHIYPCGITSAVSVPNGTLTMTTAAQAANFSNSDTLRMVVSPNRTHEGARFITNLQMPTPSNLDATLYVKNLGPHAIRDAFYLSCGPSVPGCTRAIQEVENGTTNPSTAAILFDSTNPWNNVDVFRNDDSVSTDTIPWLASKNGAAGYSRLYYLKSATPANERWKFNTATLELTNGLTDDTSTAHGLAIGEGSNTAFKYTGACTSTQVVMGVTSSDPACTTLTLDLNAGAAAAWSPQSNGNAWTMLWNTNTTETLENNTAATNGTNQLPPQLQFEGFAWNASSLACTWLFQPSFSASANDPTQTFNITPGGTGCVNGAVVVNTSFTATGSTNFNGTSNNFNGKATIDSNGRLTKLNNISSNAGGLSLGLPLGVGTFENATGTNADVSTTNLVASVAANAQFEVIASVTCTASVAGTETITIGFTDTSNTAQTFTGSANCTTLGASSFTSVIQAFRAKSGTAITVATSHTGSQPTYDISAGMYQLSVS